MTDERAEIHALLDRCGIPRTGEDDEGEVTYSLLERVEMLADRVGGRMR